MIENTNSGKYPKANLPDSMQPGEVIKPCLHCSVGISLKRWDSWNGFLVECPHCHKPHGKYWDSGNVLFASLVFNVFSFFLTMRFKKALPFFLAFAVIGVGGNYLSNRALLPNMLELLWAAIVAIGPMMVNGVILLQHRAVLDKAARSFPAVNVAKIGSRTF
jgi:hypothetical protein